MIKIQKEDAEFLELSNLVISSFSEIDDLPDLLDYIDDAIVANIVSHHDEPDKHGIKLQRIYDRIRAENIDDYLKD